MNLTINQRYYLGPVAVILLMLMATLVAYSQLQNTVPIHGNAHGQPMAGAQSGRCLCGDPA